MNTPNTTELIKNEFSDLAAGGLLAIPAGYDKVDLIVNKSYLPLLDTFPIVPLSSEQVDIDVADTACLFPMKRIVFDKEENNIQKLASIYSSAAAAEACLVLILRGYASGEVELFLGVSDEENRINGAYPKASVLLNSFKGNFPGCGDETLKILDKNETRLTVNKCFDSNYQAAVGVSCVASLRDNQKNEKNNAFYQGIEKLIESMSGRDYSVVMISRPIPPNEIQSMKEELSALYTQLYAFSKLNLSVNRSEADSVSHALSETLSEGLSRSHSSTLSSGESHFKGHQDGTFTSSSWGFSGNIGGSVSIVSAGANVSEGRGESHGNSASDGTSYGRSKGESLSRNTGKTRGKTENTSHSSNSGKSIQITLENKKVSETLVNINKQLQRLKIGNGIGMFATAAYVLAPSLADARIGACTYKAIISGDNTNLEASGINAWTGSQFYSILDYLKHLRHPVIALNRDNDLAATTTPAALVTSMELAIHMGLPQKSVNGITVRESAAFGRNIQSINPDMRFRKTFKLGNLYHLGCRENTIASLNLDSLTMHTFITGTTGSGKSNTIYGMIEEICVSRPNVHFMVIEPAKGEYKTVFGARSNVAVYGTNPYVTHLLRLNPFRFPSKVHVLEHIERLISIFNVCWPMEAAMPAILKQAVERAYIAAGWDLRRSANVVSADLYPNFDDVMHEVEKIMDESEYSGDNKGDYKGALCTRLRELTTGLNSMIFVPDDLSDEALFDENVIIDLSRIGSAEIKSLIMGLMIIRLQEYRQSTQEAPNTALRHFTVLEEAHHLLKRTSTLQTAGGANLVGKSVEMLSNALAEMRSCGEGFMIADQSPEQMDMSVIRNTNTKMIMRLPSFEDRKLVGKAVGLSEIQINELAKLPTGVAAVYQNDWLEPVLVQMPEYTKGSTVFINQPEDEAVLTDADTQSLVFAIMHKNGIEAMVSQFECDPIDGIAAMRLPTRVKRQIIDYIRDTDQNRLDRLGRIAFEFFNMQEVMLHASTGSLQAWKEDVYTLLEPSIAEFDDWDKEMLLIILAHEYTMRNRLFEPIYIELCEHMC